MFRFFYKTVFVTLVMAVIFVMSDVVSMLAFIFIIKVFIRWNSRNQICGTMKTRTLRRTKNLKKSIERFSMKKKEFLNSWCRRNMMGTMTKKLPHQVSKNQLNFRIQLDCQLCESSGENTHNSSLTISLRC